MSKIKTALISVSDKEGIAEFAKFLSKLKIEILSTAGTASLLKKKKIPVTLISDYTGQEEILDGRVKTTHPKIHAGILAVRKNKKHMKEIKKQGIKLIDMVVVNLYPFEKTVSDKKVKLKNAIENIDIGGISLIRAAAKNSEDIVVVDKIISTCCHFGARIADPGEFTKRAFINGKMDLVQAEAVAS